MKRNQPLPDAKADFNLFQLTLAYFPVSAFSLSSILKRT